MCIRDRVDHDAAVVLSEHRPVPAVVPAFDGEPELLVEGDACLLYTSEAADERSSVDLGGRRIIKKKKTQ